jgi:hypothetical protein
VWGLHTSTEGETFDLEGVNPNDPIPWDLDDIEVERLRAASQSQGGPTAGGALEGLTPASDARTRKGQRGERGRAQGSGRLASSSRGGGAADAQRCTRQFLINTRPHLPPPRPQARR